MEEQNINLFQKAIKEKQLLEFALGKNEYFLADREYGTHWNLGIWLYHIIPCLENDEGIKEISEMFNLLLSANSPQDIELNDSLLMSTYTYVSLLESSRLKIKILKDSTILEAIDKLSYYFEYLKTCDSIKYEEDQYVFNLLVNRFH